MIHADDGLLQAHLDGEMLEIDRIALESHLGVCAACRAEQDELGRASQLLHATLVASDEVAGTMAALEGFAARRHALDGAPAAANGATPLDAPRPIRPRTRQRGATTGRPLRLARGGLLKAAALALLLAGAASAAVPDWPVRQLIDAVRARLADEVEPLPAASEPAAPAAAEPADPAAQERIEPAYLLEPANGTLRIGLRSVADDALIHLRLVDEPKATIRPGDREQSGIESRTGRGWIELRNLGAGDIHVDLPRWADSLTVQVNGRTYFQKRGDQTRSPGPIVTSHPDAYVFRANP